MAVRGPPPVDRDQLWGEYPFLPGADELGAGMGLSIRDLLESPSFERARSLGRARALAGADDPRGATPIEEESHASHEERYLSFLYARLVLSSAPSGAGLRRWAVAEAKRAYHRLERASSADLLEVGRQLGFPLEERPGERLRIDLVEYVRLSVPIREADFRLAAQAVAGGSVEVSRTRAARLLQEAVRLDLARARPVDPALAQGIRERERALLDEVARRTPLPVSRGGVGARPLQPDRFPPCIRKMRRMLEAGENLSHSGRFALAAFLHRAGADAETIVDAYRGAPDFDESITRYQVEHITQRDDGRGYEPPECATLRSHGLCFREGDPSATSAIDRARDALCFEPILRHPLQYYRLRGGWVMETRAEEPTAPSGPGSGRSAGPERTRSTARR